MTPDDLEGTDLGGVFEAIRQTAALAAPAA